MTIPNSYSIAAILMSISLLNGCASNSPPAPPRFWGSVGFYFEANEVSGNQKALNGSAAVMGCEKKLDQGFALGGEVALKNLSGRSDISR